MWFLYSFVASALWAMANVLDSMVVKRYPANPLTLMWCSGFWKLLILGVLPLMGDIRTNWAVPLLALGALFYVGGILYYHVLKHIDASITQASWAIEAILLSIAGFLIFHETWTAFQTLGALLIIGAVFLLTYWHKHVSIVRTFLLLSLLALCFAPEEMLKKAAILAGEEPFPVFYWAMWGNAALSFLAPALFRRFRRDAQEFLSRSNAVMHAAFASGNLLSFLAFFLLALAYQSGPLSLVSIASSGQPFFVILFAWITTQILPRYAPRELLTAQSIGVKVLSFAIATAGLSLLARG